MCQHAIQDGVERLPGWIVGPCLKCGKEISMPLQQWAARATGPDALTDEMRARLKSDAPAL
jgi:hypothetical protein